MSLMPARQDLTQAESIGEEESTYQLTGFINEKPVSSFQNFVQNGKSFCKTVCEKCCQPDFP
jgi:hypothetical protein